MVRLNDIGCAHEKTMSNPATAPAGTTCEVGKEPASSASSKADTATEMAERSSLAMAKERDTVVITEIVPKSSVLGPAAARTLRVSAVHRCSAAALLGSGQVARRPSLA